MNLQSIRKLKGITQEDLARVLNVSRATIAMWETGRTSPDVSTLIKMADFFDCSVDAIVGHNFQGIDPIVKEKVSPRIVCGSQEMELTGRIVKIYVDDSVVEIKIREDK